MESTLPMQKSEFYAKLGRMVTYLAHKYPGPPLLHRVQTQINELDRAMGAAVAADDIPLACELARQYQNLILGEYERYERENESADQSTSNGACEKCGGLSQRSTGPFDNNGPGGRGSLQGSPAPREEALQGSLFPKT